MTKESIEHVLRCLSTNKYTYTFTEHEEEGSWGNMFVYQIWRNSESLVKYEESDSGYQTKDSARENFILRFLEFYLKHLEV